MKRFLGVVGFLAVFALSSPGQPLSGTKTIPGDYADLSTAFAAINTNGVSATLTLSLTGNFTEPGTTALTRSDLTSSTNVIIVPSASTQPIITVSGTNGIDINGADYVTIDGSNSGGTSKDLTIRRSASAAGSSIIYVHATATNITVKNCFLGDATNTPDYALRIDGASAVTVQNNEIHGIGNTNGIIYLNSVTGTTNLVTQNTISGDQAGGTKAFGIYVTGASGTITLSKNKLHTLQTSGTGGIAGIKEGMVGGTLNVENNFIGGSFVSSSSSDYYLLDFRGTSGKQVYNNTLVLNSIAGSPSFEATNLYIQDGTGDFRNNIVYNNFNSSISYCIYNGLPTSSDLTTNYNDLYAPGVNNSIGYDGITTYDPLSGWQNWVGVNPDPNSVSVAVTFSNIASDFHLSGGSNGDTQLRGTNGLVVDDIDGEARLTNPNGPYMGADEGTAPLPVQLANFAAVGGESSVQLFWSTATEVDNYGFEVERRTVQSSMFNVQGSKTLNPDLGTWNLVGFVRGSGTSSSPHEYSFSDRSLSPGRYAYRLKQIDHSGSSEYFGSVEVQIGQVAAEFTLRENYPNPFNPSTMIRFSVREVGPATLKVFNLLGQEIVTLFNGQAEPGRLYEAQFIASSLPSGLYIARLQSGKEQKLLKMSLTK